MPRRPEIGNRQLYPNQPLRASDRNGYVLKFYCVLRQKRVGKNCGTRDRREARKILRECRERLLNGKYADSGGAITAKHEPSKPLGLGSANEIESKSWQGAYAAYRAYRLKRQKKDSFKDASVRLSVADTIFENRLTKLGQPEGIGIRDTFTLETMDYLQERLLDGEAVKRTSSSPSTVNSYIDAVLAFVRNGLGLIRCHRLILWMLRRP